MIKCLINCILLPIMRVAVLTVKYLSSYGKQLKNMRKSTERLKSIITDFEGVNFFAPPYTTEVYSMLIKDAVVLRLQILCKERNIKYNELATRSGVTPSTVYSLMDINRRDLSIITLKKLCDGLDMTITDFFDDDIFKFMEQEIK